MHASRSTAPLVHHFSLLYSIPFTPSTNSVLRRCRGPNALRANIASPAYLALSTNQALSLAGHNHCTLFYVREADPSPHNRSIRHRHRIRPSVLRSCPYCHIAKLLRHQTCPHNSRLSLQSPPARITSCRHIRNRSANNTPSSIANTALYTVLYPCTQTPHTLHPSPHQPPAIGSPATFTHLVSTHSTHNRFLNSPLLHSPSLPATMHTPPTPHTTPNIT
jgi:hypothetical protein